MVRRHILGLSLGLIVGVTLTVASLCDLQIGRHPVKTVLLLCFGLVIFTITVREWFGLWAGRTIFETLQTVRLKGGVISFPEPNYPYEIWMFCDVPFARYHGSIAITNSLGEVHTIIVPQHGFWSKSIRSDFQPLIWRSPKVGIDTEGQGLLTFNLVPTFANTDKSLLFPADEFESVTVIIKAL